MALKTPLCLADSSVWGAAVAFYWALHEITNIITNVTNRECGRALNLHELIFIYLFIYLFGHLEAEEQSHGCNNDAALTLKQIW